MRRSVNSLSPITPLPSTPPPPMRTSPLGGATPPKQSPPGSMNMPNSASRPTLSISNVSSNRCSSLLDADDITPITSPLPNILCPQEIYTIFSRTDDPDGNGSNLASESSRLTAVNHRNSIFLANSASANNSNPTGASSKSRSRRSSVLSQNNRSDRSASASMKSSQSSSIRRKRSSTHIEMNATMERPRCLKSSFLRRKCKEYAGE